LLNSLRAHAGDDMLISYPTRRDTISLTNTCKNKKLSCCCDSRSHLHQFSAYTVAALAVNNLQTPEWWLQCRYGILANYQTGFVYKFTSGWYARSDSTDRVYQTLSTQAWPL